MKRRSTRCIRTLRHRQLFLLPDAVGEETEAVDFVGAHGTFFCSLSWPLLDMLELLWVVGVWALLIFEGC